jgi:hypothetical protein
MVKMMFIDLLNVCKNKKRVDMILMGVMSMILTYGETVRGIGGLA